MSLDFSIPYAEVHGLPGAVFEQNGSYFKRDGSIATSVSEYIEEVVAEDDSIPPPIACYEQQTSPAAKSSHDDSISGMPDKHLKVLIESFGGEWVNRKKALEFMKGK